MFRRNWFFLATLSALLLVSQHTIWAKSTLTGSLEKKKEQKSPWSFTTTLITAINNRQGHIQMPKALQNLTSIGYNLNARENLDFLFGFQNERAGLMTLDYQRRGALAVGGGKVPFSFFAGPTFTPNPRGPNSPHFLATGLGLSFGAPAGDFRLHHMSRFDVNLSGGGQERASLLSRYTIGYSISPKWHLSLQNWHSVSFNEGENSGTLSTRFYVIHPVNQKITLITGVLGQTVPMISLHDNFMVLLGAQFSVL